MAGTTTGITQTSATLNWTASAGATGYRIYHPNGVQWTTVGGTSCYIGALNGNPSPLSPGQTYTYQVTAINEYGAESDRTYITFTTLAGPPPMPVTTATHFRTPTDFPRYGGTTGNFHGGTDLAIQENVNAGDTVVAVFGGTVRVASYQTNNSYGNLVVIDSVVNGITYKFYYAHMQTSGFATNLVIDSPVSQGATLGYVGNTGAGISANHLHFEVRKHPYEHNIDDCVDPRSFYN